jgi:DNA-binding PadR family transcriptional regulator
VGKIMSDLLGRLFYAGFIRLHILHHAAEAPICGVDIVAELGRHGYRLSPGTVYPVLHELQKARYLTVRSSVVGGKMRKYYVATAAGRKALKQARGKLHELAAEVLHDERKRRTK